MLEGAKAKTENVDALKTGASAMKAMQKTTNIDDIDKTMDEINEQTENMKQFQKALSAPIGSAADFDEDELEAELEELECAELEEQLLQPVPIHVPQGNKPNVVMLGQQSSFNISGISDLYSDNLVGDDRRKDRLVVPSHGQDSIFFKRPPSSHCSSSHERLLERMSDSASRTAASSYGGIEGGARRKLGAP